MRYTAGPGLSACIFESKGDCIRSDCICFPSLFLLKHLLQERRPLEDKKKKCNQDKNEGRHLKEASKIGHKRERERKAAVEIGGRDSYKESERNNGVVDVPNGLVGTFVTE